MSEQDDLRHQYQDKLRKAIERNASADEIDAIVDEFLKQKELPKKTEAAATIYPRKHKEYREADVSQDRCPECGGELDTGWECNDCGYDARPIARSI